MITHRWSGWPGAWCLDCGCEDRHEIAIADGAFEVSDDGKTIIIAPEYKNGECPEPGSNRHNPYGKENTMKTIPLLLKNNPTCSFTYRNWRNETARRHVQIISIWYGRTTWHPEEQWFMHGLDRDKSELRDFAMQDITDVVILP